MFLQRKYRNRLTLLQSSLPEIIIFDNRANFKWVTLSTVPLMLIVNLSFECLSTISDFNKPNSELKKTFAKFSIQQPFRCIQKYCRRIHNTFVVQPFTCSTHFQILVRAINEQRLEFIHQFCKRTTN